MIGATPDDLIRLEKAIHQLPFVSHTAAGIDLWMPEEVENDDEALILGEQYARATMGLAKHLGSPALIAMVLADIVKGGDVGTLEASFLISIASAARAGAMS